MIADSASLETSVPAVPLVPLSDLRRGARGTMHAAQLPCDECEFLRAMGMTERCRFRVCRTGEPCIVMIDSTRLGLSRAVSRSILVSPAAPAAPAAAKDEAG